MRPAAHAWTWPWAALFAAGLAAVRAVPERWLCDDAFVSFRYADNLVAGLGLVFNAEERVEGYTNFLWTLLLAAGRWLGVPIEPLSQGLGIACFVATVVLLAWTTSRLAPAGRAAVAVPIAALGTALHGHLAAFASCGLETALFTWLVLVLFLCLVHADSARAAAVAGLAGVLAMLTRPDGAVLVAAGGIVLLWSDRRRALVLGYLAPIATLFLPYLVWRWTYYGWLLPNTFYAKSAHDPWPGQGFVYAGLYFAAYWVLVPALVAAVLFVARPNATKEPGLASRGPVLLAAFVLSYLGFVVWVGGDFMFGRFLLPVTPLLYLALELVLRRRLGPRGLLIAAGALATATLLPWLPRALDRRLGGSGIAGIMEERSWYTAEVQRDRRRTGERLRELLVGCAPRVLVTGGQIMLAYYARFPYVLEGATGLTDEFLAHRERPVRGRVGHEKNVFEDAEGEAYIGRRSVDFMLVNGVDLSRGLPINMVDLGFVQLRLFRWNPALIDRLRRAPGARVPDIEAALDAFLGAMPSLPKQAVRERYEREMRPFYFAHNADPARQRAIEEYLGR